MIVYGHRTFDLPVQTFLIDVGRRIGEVRRSPGVDELTDLLVDFGEAYAAAADALAPQVDAIVDSLQPWTAALSTLADAVCAIVREDRAGVDQALDVLARGHAGLAPLAGERPVVPASTPEGFAYYGLHPEQYIGSAERYVAAARPATLTCLGLRGIGAPLACVVAAAARRAGVSTRVFTARPRGHPFDRRLLLSTGLQACLAAGSSGHAVVVDEGPGLSGSSFAAGVDALLDAGFSRDRIALFASWRPDQSALCAARGRDAFLRTASFVVDSDDAAGGTDREDLSAGKWRAAVFANERSWPAVHPQHERRKLLSAHGTRLERFVGLGRHGRSMRRRAEKLAESGFAVPPLGMNRGLMCREWIRGTPCDRQVCCSSRALRTFAEYAAFVARSFRTGRRAAVSDLIAMMAANCREAGMDNGAIDLSGLERLGEQFDEPEVAVDGRMLPHDWLADEGRLVKTDALDHHADDFLPGCRDIAWDLAGAIVEMHMHGGASAALVEHYRRSSGDSSIDRRLAFYVPAYACYRLGYATLAAQSLKATADGVRFARLTRRYRRSLEESARRLRPFRQC